MPKPHQLLGRHILAIIAHPDDEGFLMSGLAWKNHRSGGRTTIVCATLGEKGTAHLKKPMTTAALKTIRRRELMRATKFVGIDRVYVLGLPDGGVKPKLPTLVRLAKAKIKREKPDVLVSFGPDGYTAHRDHIAAWKATSQLAREFRLPQYAFTVPTVLAKRMPDWLFKQRFNPHYDQMKPYLKPALRIPTPAGLKRRVLRHYPSQVSQTKPYSHMPASAAKLMMAAEYFARVR